jgi:hypothetical protein
MAAPCIPFVSPPTYELRESGSRLPERGQRHRAEARVLQFAFVKWSLILLPLYLGGLSLTSLPEKEHLGVMGIEGFLGFATAFCLLIGLPLLPRLQKLLLKTWLLKKAGVFEPQMNSGLWLPWRNLRAFRLRETNPAPRTGELILEDRAGRNFTLVFNASNVDLGEVRTFLSQHLPEA